MPDEQAPRRRPERPEDAGFRLHLFRDTHGGVLAGIDPALADTMLRQQLAGQTIMYRARYPDARCEIIEDPAGTPIGRLVVDRADAAITLVDIALLSAHRGRGMGTRLVRELIAEARAAALPVQLRVRADNPARRLYKRLGFVGVGENEMDVTMEWGPSLSCYPSIV